MHNRTIDGNLHLRVGAREVVPIYYLLIKLSHIFHMASISPGINLVCLLETLDAPDYAFTTLVLPLISSPLVAFLVSTTRRE